MDTNYNFILLSWMCQGESYSRLAYKHDTKRIVEESEM